MVPQTNGESSKVKVKVRVSIHGLFSVSSATMTEKIETVSEPMEVDATMNGPLPESAAGAEPKASEVNKFENGEPVDGQPMEEQTNSSEPDKAPADMETEKTMTADVKFTMVYNVQNFLFINRSLEFFCSEEACS